MKKIAYILIAVFAFIACDKTDLSGIESDINSIENRLNNIEKTVLSSINSSIAALEAAKGKTEERLSALEKDNGYGTEINNLKTQIGNLESQISELRKYAENLTQGVKEWADLKFATIESLNNALVTLSDLQKNVANLPDSNAVNQAIENALKSVTASISALEQRVDAIEKMIQSVTIIPDYADGSIKAEDGNLKVNFIVCPAEALVSIIENNYMDCIKLLVKSVETKSSGLYQEVEYDEVIILDEAEGTARLKANVSDLMPSDDEHALSVALKVKNGISCYTTDFVGVVKTSHQDTKVLNGHKGIQLWDGGPYWAETNIGAEFPFDSGDYYAWGATELAYSEVTFSYSGTPQFVGVPARPDSYGEGDWDRDNVFSEINAPYCKTIIVYGDAGSWLAYAFSKYNEEDNKYILEPRDDAAYVNWGSYWRIPKHEDFIGLVTNCVWLWTDNYDNSSKSGYIVYKAKTQEDKGKYYYDGVWYVANEDSNSKRETSTAPKEQYRTSDSLWIFIPAGGFGLDSTGGGEASGGYYWASEKDTNQLYNSEAYFLSFSRGYIKYNLRISQSSGHAIRPVSY